MSKPSDKLTEICNATRQEVAKRQQQQSTAQLEAIIAQQASDPYYQARGFAKQLASTNGTALICELKRASPSGGNIRPNFDPAAHAAAYETGGARCLSVLTDAPYFHGTLQDLEHARRACTLPILRKDFMVDPWQILETKAAGADCILLIMAVLSDAEATDMLTLAHEYQLDVLVEVHDAAELKRAVQLPLEPDNDLLGINNRNLKTLVTNINNTAEMLAGIPTHHGRLNGSGPLLVSESGVKTKADIQQIYTATNVNTFLIGESLLRQPDLTAATKTLLQ